MIFTSFFFSNLQDEEVKGGDQKNSKNVASC